MLLFSVRFTVGPPEAPKPPVVSEVRTTCCTITYQPPPDDGGAPLTGHILQRRTPGPDSRWIGVNDIPATELQYTIRDLIPATEYEFRVAAVNKLETTSDFSLTSPKIMTVEAPDMPGRPEVLGVTGTSVRLQWTVPNSDGGTDITGYVVTFSTSEETKNMPIAISADANAEPLISYTIRDQLQAKTNYRFAVAAVNRVGQGPWSDTTDPIATFAGTWK